MLICNLARTNSVSTRPLTPLIPSVTACRFCASSIASGGHWATRRSASTRAPCPNHSRKSGRRFQPRSGDMTFTMADARRAMIADGSLIWEGGRFESTRKGQAEVDECLALLPTRLAIADVMEKHPTLTAFGFDTRTSADFETALGRLFFRFDGVIRGCRRMDQKRSANPDAAAAVLLKQTPTSTSAKDLRQRGRVARRVPA